MAKNLVCWCTPLPCHADVLLELANTPTPPPTPLRILVTGSRTWTNHQVIRDYLTRYRGRYPGAVLVHGNARGADRIAAHLWRTWGIPVETHPADWDTHGRAAGLLRNAAMVAAGAAVCLAFIHNNSPGATHCADLAQRAGIPTVRLHQCGGAQR